MNDPRRFGAVLWHGNDDGELDQHVLLRGLGVEPLEDGFTGDTCCTAPAATRSAPDQAGAAGGRHRGRRRQYLRLREPVPRRHQPEDGGRRASAVRRYDKLAEAIRDILAEAIVQGGSTLRDFIAVNGQSGYFQQTYFVYDRAGVPCRNCGAPVRQIVQGQRSTFYCVTLPEVRQQTGEPDGAGFSTVQRVARRAWSSALEQLPAAGCNAAELLDGATEQRIARALARLARRQAVGGLRGRILAR